MDLFRSGAVTTEGLLRGGIYLMSGHESYLRKPEGRGQLLFLMRNEKLPIEEAILRGTCLIFYLRGKGRSYLKGSRRPKLKGGT